MSGLTLLTDQPIRIAVECEVCDGTGTVTNTPKGGTLKDPDGRRLRLRAAWVCATCDGRGFNLTKTGRQLVHVLKPYILEEDQ